MTLVEVMVAATLLTITGMALVASFIQNKRMALAIAYRTTATTQALSVSEQLRVNNYAAVADIVLATLGTPPVPEPGKDPQVPYFEIDVLDPTDTTATNGVVSAPFRINELNGSPVDSVWTSRNTPFTFDVAAKNSSILIPMRYWISVTLQKPTTDKNGVTFNKCDLYEIALTYQWRNPNTQRGTGWTANEGWQSGVIRIVTPNANLDTAPVP